MNFKTADVDTEINTIVNVYMYAYNVYIYTHTYLYPYLGIHIIYTCIFASRLPRWC